MGVVFDNPRRHSLKADFLFLSGFNNLHTFSVNGPLGAGGLVYQESVYQSGLAPTISLFSVF